MRKFKVKIAEKLYSPEFQTKEEFRRQWQSVLKKARAEGAKIHCTCPGRGEKRLSAKYYSASDNFGLAIYPKTGDEHAIDCVHNAIDSSKSGLSGYADNVLTEMPDGQLSIRLGIGLKKQDVQDETLSGSEARKSRGAKRPSMTNLGLLHLLWQEGDLNRWWPKMSGRRDYRTFRRQVVKAAQRIQVGKTTLYDALLLPAMKEGSVEAQRNANLVEDAIRQNRRLLAIYPLREWTEQSEVRNYLPVVGAFGVPFLTLNAGAWKRMSERFPYAMSIWRKGGKVIALSIVEPANNAEGKQRAYVLATALMAVTEHWIPVESSYELTVAEQLVEQGRAFIKPLRYDAATEVVFPDFVLVDTGAEAGTPLEVFGRSDERYERRKAEKIRYYGQKFGVDGWWMWNAAAGDGMPAFPLGRNAQV